MHTEQNIAFRVYKDAKAHLGVASAEMPQVQFITETIAGSGVAGEYESPAMGMTGSMTCKLSWISQSREFYSLLEEGESNNLELRASIQQLEETTGRRTSAGLRISMVAVPKSSSLGSLETGKKQGNETELEVLRMLVELDGKEKLLIDKFNFIYRVNGNDKLGLVRSHLGMEF